jgi:hypothetical protein
MRLRRVGGALAAVVVLGVAPACADREDPRDVVRDALRATDRLSYRYVYEERAEGEKIRVDGLVEDDFRYQARLFVDDRATYDEVVSDDSVAARLLDRARLPQLVRPDAATTSEEQRVAATALQQQRWVRDRSGAPFLVPTGREERKVGEDPVIDSLTLFRYVELAMGEAAGVYFFNEESIEYKPKEDPFPRPKRRSGVKRYDFERGALPRAEDARASGQNQRVPGASQFRKMAIYIKDGRVIEIREAFDIATLLDDIIDLYEIKFPKGTTTAQAIDSVVKAMNQVRRGQGLDPIRPRTMVYKLSQLGRKQEVQFPTDVVDGSLSILRNRGRVEQRSTAGGGGGGGGEDGSTPTTASG